MAVGLDWPVGIAGGRLSMTQRQKLGLARAVVKRPDVLVMFDPLSPLDHREQIEVRDAVLAATRGSDGDLGPAARDWASEFDQVIQLDAGRLVRGRAAAGRARREKAPASLMTAE